MSIRLIDANKLQTTTTYFGISDTPVEVVKKSIIDNAKTVEAVPLTELKDKMLKYGFTAPDMTVTEFVEDFETL